MGTFHAGVGGEGVASRRLPNVLLVVVVFRDGGDDMFMAVD